MVKKMSLILCVVLVSCSSSNFTVRKIPVVSNKLHLNGCYYNNFLNPESENEVFIYFLYSNGVFFNQNTVFKTLENGLQYYKDNQKGLKDRNHYPIEKSYWGLYRIIGDSIILEKPEPAMGFPVLRHTGKILNDSTFVINKAKEEGQKEHSFKNAYHYFRKFEYKPDSTNRFTN